MVDAQAKLLAQLSDLRVETATLKTRQDFAFERLQGFLEKYERDEERRSKDQEACRDMLHEILITQKTYNRIITRVIPFAVVIFTVVVSWAAAWRG